MSRKNKLNNNSVIVTKNLFPSKYSVYAFVITSLSETLNNEMHCLSSFTGLMKDMHMWSKMAKGKGPKPPVFKYQISLFINILKTSAQKR